MKTFDTNFNTEKNKKTGIQPVWILKIPFSAGTHYLSDRVFTVTGWGTGPTTKAWIASWGTIDESIDASLTTPTVSDFSVEIIVDPDEATDIHDLLWSESVETLDAELYLWFIGLDASSDPPTLFWTGNIIDFEKVNELLYRVSLVDESVRVDKRPGRILSLADYANASLDDVGYQLPILYGTIEKVPALRLDVGKITTLTAAIDADDVDFYVADGTGFSNGSDMLIDGEQIHITTISSNHVTACTRGYNSTTAAAHSAGATVVEKQTTCVFLYADHPVKSIGNIYAKNAAGKDVDITSVCTKYTGQTGSELTGYSGMAVVTTPGYVTFDVAVSLGLTDTVSWTADTDGEWVETRFGNGSPLTANQSNQSPSSEITAPAMNTDTPVERWMEIYFTGGCSTPPTSGSETGKIYIIKQTDNSNWRSFSYEVCSLTTSGMVMTASSPLITTLTTTGGWDLGSTWGNMDCPCKPYFDGTSSGGTYSLTIDNVKYCQRYDLAVDLDKTGSVTLTNNGLADYAIGDQISISGEGYKDDGSGTFTGSASALIERPDHIYKHFLYTYASWPVADFSTDAGTPFGSDGYKFSVVMNTRKSLKEWCAYMALQCRCWFRFAAGKAYLTYRPDSLSSDKTITAAMVRMNADNTTSARISRSPLDEIINKISVHYCRDWAKTAGREAYQAVTSTSDATSIAAYGEKEQPDTFLFDFVRDATMAADLRDFYLARYKDRKKVATFDLFLDNAELEFADAITVTPLGSLVGEIRKCNLAPGGMDRNDMITITMREY